MKTAKPNYLNALWRYPLLLCVLIIMPALLMLGRLLRIPQHTQIVHVFHSMVCMVLGLKKKFSGEISQAAPCLYVSNHISYLDIFVLGGLRGHFIAKSEVANWPILGFMSRFQNTLFFERKTGKAREQLRVMQEHLGSAKRLILFPEGTSTDGRHVLPFKSSLFEAANLSNSATRVAIQPITLAYTHYAGDKMTQAMRDNYAWYGTMPFAGHFFNLFNLKKVDVKVHFHPVCYLDDFATRKECADYCQQVVVAKLDELMMN